jgi:hypothetical protein
LHVATATLTPEYARERKVPAALTREVQANGLTQARRTRLIGLLNDADVAYQRIKYVLDRPIQASDPRLIDGRKSLDLVGYQIGVSRLMFSSSSAKDWQDKINTHYGNKLPAVLQRLQFLSVGNSDQVPAGKGLELWPSECGGSRSSLRPVDNAGGLISAAEATSTG